MTTPTLSELLGILSEIAPPSLAQEWDRTGLQLGDLRACVSRVMVALDPERRVIEQAIERRCELLVTHHPLLFHPLSSIRSTDPVGALILTASSAKMAIHSMHTNYDAVKGGLGDLLAGVAGLVDPRPLLPPPSNLRKLVLFVPSSHESLLLDALSPLAARIGSYGDCTFRGVGRGTFRPLDGSSPFVGRHGVREEVEEVRLEFLVDLPRIDAVLQTMRRVHPYEEPAFDIYPVLQTDRHAGIGRVGDLSEPTTLGTYSSLIASTLRVPVRVYGPPDRTLRRVAVCPGSGASLIQDAVSAGADLLLTGDVKHHDAMDAARAGICLIDAGHYGTERMMVPAVARRIRELADQNGYRIQVFEADETLPFWETSPSSD